MTPRNFLASLAVLIALLVTCHSCSFIHFSAPPDTSTGSLNKEEEEEALGGYTFYTKVAPPWYALKEIFVYAK